MRVDEKENSKMRSRSSYLFMLAALIAIPCAAQEAIDMSGFQDGSHHWYDIEDEDKVITALPNQPRYKPGDIREIADNILLFQKSNGGWPKNYDMLAVLTIDQKRLLDSVKEDTNTTFDNGATHSQVEFLAKAFEAIKDQRYRDACLKGIDFMLASQYPNGGWPQFYPDTSGYRKYITFNDGAMIGVMRVLHNVLRYEPQYSFVTGERREQAGRAFQQGLGCILKCQVDQNGIFTAWGQQHDNIDYHPQDARTFEPASLSGRESAEIVLFLMSIDRPGERVISAVNAAVHWFSRSKIPGVKVEEFKAPTAHFKYRTVDYDLKVVNDPNAPPIWARMYELVTNRPLFCNRDKKPVYSLTEVERERRTGYSWYVYTPADALEKYPAWQTKWSPSENVLAR